ncbi:hypothetical protein BH18ACI2_BH18ACI2_30650 [soil metagenome]
MSHTLAMYQQDSFPQLVGPLLIRHPDRSGIIPNLLA